MSNEIFVPTKIFSISFFFIYSSPKISLNVSRSAVLCNGIRFQAAVNLKWLLWWWVCLFLVFCFVISRWFCITIILKDLPKQILWIIEWIELLSIIELQIAIYIRLGFLTTITLLHMLYVTIQIQIKWIW